MKAVIKSISADQTWPIRQRVFGPDQPMSQSMLDDDQSGQHFGALVDGKVVAVGSLFLEADGRIRLRKLATLPDFQNLGIGTLLLKHLLAEADYQGRDVWCVVRSQSLDYYREFGFEPFGDAFMKGSHEHQPLVRLAARAQAAS